MHMHDPGPEPCDPQNPWHHRAYPQQPGTGRPGAGLVRPRASPAQGGGAAAGSATASPARGGSGATAPLARSPAAVPYDAHVTLTAPAVTLFSDLVNSSSSVFSLPKGGRAFGPTPPSKAGSPHPHSGAPGSTPSSMV